MSSNIGIPGGGQAALKLEELVLQAQKQIGSLVSGVFFVALNVERKMFEEARKLLNPIFRPLSIPVESL